MRSVREKGEENAKRAKGCDKEIHKIKKEMGLLESKEAVQALSERLEKFSAIEHIDKLINVFLPKVQ